MDPSLTDSEFISEVRDALAGLDQAKIPDATITQARDRYVLPLLNDRIDSNVDQERFDNVAILWTAEASFDAWLAFTRLRDAELETFTRPEKYKEQLTSRTNTALRQVNVTRPSEYPNTVISVKREDDSDWEKVQLEPGRWTA